MRAIFLENILAFCPQQLRELHSQPPLFVRMVVQREAYFEVRKVSQWELHDTRRATARVRQLEAGGQAGTSGQV